MTINRRAALGAFALASTNLWAQAPAYPTKGPIKLIVPFPPGGGGDGVARLMAEALAKKLNQNIIVENKPGADQVIGTAALAQSPADGYTLMMTGDTMMTHAAYERPLPYNVFKDLTPVSRIAQVPIALLVNPKLGVKNVQELISMAKANPGKLKAGHIGSASPHYLTVKTLEHITGAKFLDVPYRGSGPTTLAVVSGEIDLVFAGVGSAKQLADGGRALLLGVTGAKRAGSAPNVPTLMESGIPNLDTDTAFYIYAPGATPQPIIQRLDQEVQAIVGDPAIQARLTSMGFEPDVGNHDKSVVEHKRRYDTYKSLIKTLNIQWSE